MTIDQAVRTARPGLRATRSRAWLLLAALAWATPVHAESKTPAAKPTAERVAGSDVPAKYLAAGRYQEGLDWLHASGRSTPDHDRYAGLFHHGLGHADAALKQLVPIHRADPDDDVVALAVAEASLWKKDLKTALGVVAALQAPEAPEALRVRGLALEQAGRLAEALALYERAIPHLPRPWGTVERKAQVLSWLKRFDEAKAVYATVVASKQASIELRRRCRVRSAEITAWQKDFDGALAQLAQLLAEEPRLTDALLLRGQILEWQGKFADAKRAYSRILAIDAAHAEARLRLEKLLWVE